MENSCILETKAINRFPEIPAAGVLSGKNDASMKEIMSRPISSRNEIPDVCNRVRQWTDTPLEEKRIFHAQINDPQLAKANEMTHGITGCKDENSATLINPPAKSTFQENHVKKMESIYESTKRKPLGSIPDQTESFPADFDYNSKIFGIKTVYSGTAKDCCDSGKSYPQLIDESLKDHDTYLVSHKRVFPGEQMMRGYTDSYMQDERYGIKTHHNNEGLLTKQSVKWHTETNQLKSDAVVSKRVDDYRERFQSKLGLPLDPIKDTMKVGPDHRFGLISTEKSQTVQQNLRPERIEAVENLVPASIGITKNRALIGAIRNHLRSINWDHCADLRNAFDGCSTSEPFERNPNSINLIEESIVRQVLNLYEVPLQAGLLDQYLQLCRLKSDSNSSDQSSLIDVKVLLEGFDWKNGKNFDDIIAIQKEELTNPTEPELTDSYLKSTWHTTNSMYNGGSGIDLSKSRALGVPSMRPDLPIPKARKTTDSTNYGDEGHVGTLINPTIMTLHGVSDLDLQVPRSRSELQQLFHVANNEKYSNEDFDKIWEICLNSTQVQSAANDDCKLNIRQFRSAVDQFNTEKIRKNLSEQLTKELTLC